MPTRSACEETGRKPPDPRRLRIRGFDAIRRRPDTLTRITRPPYGLPVRGRGNTGLPPACAQYSLSTQREASAGCQARGCLVFVRPIQGRTGSVRAERTEAASQQLRSDSCGYVEPRSLRWRGTPDFESGGRRFDSGRGDMLTWCNPASIRSCHGRDPGSNPGVGVPGRRSRPGARRNTFRRCGCVDEPRGDTHRGRQPVGAISWIVLAVLGPAGSATYMSRCGIPGRTRSTPPR